MGDLCCKQCNQRGLPCSAGTGRHDAILPAANEPTSPPPQALETESQHLVDLYFRYMHDKPHSLFHEPSFKLSVVNKAVSRPVLLSMMGLSAR